MAGTFMVPQYTILHCKRVAVRPTEGEPWRWFSPIVYFTISGYFTSPQWFYPTMVLESFCEEAVEQYPLTSILVVEAPTPEAFDLIDMTKL